jgi:hypothetical protein
MTRHCYLCAKEFYVHDLAHVSATRQDGTWESWLFCDHCLAEAMKILRRNNPTAMVVNNLTRKRPGEL